MTDLNREAFKAWIKSRNKWPTDIDWQSVMGSIWVSGAEEAWQACAAHYAPKLTEEDAAIDLANFFALQEYHANGFETLGSVESYLARAVGDHMANARNCIARLRAAGVRWREEA